MDTCSRIEEPGGVGWKDVNDDRLRRTISGKRSPAPNRIWLAQITYIETDQGRLYLAAVMDLYSRRREAGLCSFRADSVLAALAAGFTGLLGIVGEVAALLTGAATTLGVLALVAVFAAFLAGLGGTLRIVREVSGTAALFIRHRHSPSIAAPKALG